MQTVIMLELAIFNPHKSCVWTHYLSVSMCFFLRKKKRFVGHLQLDNSLNRQKSSAIMFIAWFGNDKQHLNMTGPPKWDFCLSYTLAFDTRGLGSTRSWDTSRKTFVLATEQWPSQLFQPIMESVHKIHLPLVAKAIAFGLCRFNTPSLVSNMFLTEWLPWKHDLRAIDENLSVGQIRENI